MTPCDAAMIAPPRHLSRMIDDRLVRRDQQLLQEPELPVPHQRRGADHRREQHRHAQDAGEDERLQVDAIRGDGG